MERTGKIFGFNDEFLEGLCFFKNIYRKVPPWYPGAKRVLDYWKSTEQKMGLVTHANQKWHDIKEEGLGLRGYFSYIKVVGENRRKGIIDWQEAARELDIDPKKTIVLGDDIRADMCACRLGMRGIYIKSESPAATYGELPKGAIRVKNISDVIRAAYEME